LLLERRIPTAFTSFNQTEANEDAAVLEKLGASFFLPPQENPFHSLHPMREPEAMNKFYYNHYYVMGIHGTHNSK